MSLCFVLLLTGGNQTALDRYAELIQRSQAVEFKFSSRGLNAAMTYEPGKRFRMVSKGKDVDYVLIENVDRVLEINHSTREYDDMPLRKLGTPPARVSRVSAILPFWLLQRDLRELLPKGASFEEKGKVKVSSGEGVRFFNRATSPDKSSWQETEVVLTDNGAPLDVHLKGMTPQGPYEYQWSLSGFRSIARPAASFYVPRIPDGYSPFALHSKFGLPELGEKMPLDGWKTNAGGSLDFRKALPQGGLVAILGTDSDPSDRAKASLGRLRDRKLPLLILSDQKADFAAGYDAGGLAKLATSATPLFIKLDAAGTVVGMWLGYDAAKAKQFEQDVLDAK